MQTFLRALMVVCTLQAFAESAPDKAASTAPYFSAALSACQFHRRDDGGTSEIGQAKGTGDRRIGLGDDIGRDDGRAGNREYSALLHGCEGGQHVEVQFNRAAICYTNHHELTAQIDAQACRFVHVIGVIAHVVQLG